MIVLDKRAYIPKPHRALKAFVTPEMRSEARDFMRGYPEYVWCHDCGGDGCDYCEGTGQVRVDGA